MWCQDIGTYYNSILSFIILPVELELISCFVHNNVFAVSLVLVSRPLLLLSEWFLFCNLQTQIFLNAGVNRQYKNGLMVKLKLNRTSLKCFRNTWNAVVALYLIVTAKMSNMLIGSVVITYAEMTKPMMRHILLIGLLLLSTSAIFSALLFMKNNAARTAIGIMKTRMVITCMNILECPGGMLSAKKNKTLI